MAEQSTTQLWINRTVFLALAFIIIIFQLLPLDARPIRWPGPDILLVATLAWVARRPDYLPVIVVAAIFLTTDLLFQRPPGLWAALVVILTEAIRKRAHDIRNMPIAIEWGMIATGVVLITLANRLVLAIVMIPQTPLALTMIQMIFTILVYPLVALIARFAFGISRSAPGEIGLKGRRI